VSERTLKREWTFIRTWLRNELRCQETHG
jgi:hypothetical protein